jgi:hypothetical protein
VKGGKGEERRGEERRGDDGYGSALLRGRFVYLFTWKGGLDWQVVSASSNHNQVHMYKLCTRS